MNSEVFTVREKGEGAIRADCFVASLGMFTRSQIDRRSVTIRDLGGRKLKLSKRLAEGSKVVVEWEDPPSCDIAPEPLNLRILYEDDNSLVIDKEQGVVVHPAHTHMHGTLVQGLLHRYAQFDTLFPNDRVRPGIVHRLDKDTSGIIITAKNPQALEFLSAQFRDQSVKKHYLAITRGIPRNAEGEIDSPIGRHPYDRKTFAVNVPHAKTSLTRYRLLGQAADYALLLLRILTGRTHQIRVHLKSMGTAVLGDPIYGVQDSLFLDATLMLHSWKLAIEIQGAGKKNFTAELPSRFCSIMDQLGMKLPEDLLD